MISLLLLAACVGFLWGVVKLFKKGQRRRSLMYLGASVAVLMASASLVGMQNERNAKVAGFGSYAEQQAADAAEQDRRLADLITQNEQELREEQERLDALAREQGYESHAAQQEAERRAELEALREQRGDFPSLAVKARAEALGITRYAAYRLLEDQNAIAAYCEYSPQAYQIADAKFAAIDGGADEAVATQRAEAEQVALLDRFNAALGLQGHEMTTLSITGHWDWHCRAQELGWVAVTQDNLETVTRDQARQAEDTLKAVYEDQLRNGSLATNIFDPIRNGFVTCDLKGLNEMWFVQCQAKGYSLNSPLHHYAVAWHRAEDYPLLVALNGNTMSTWERIGTDAQRLADTPFAPAIYAGPSLPISDILAVFD
ncbi:MAG: hypothetical protein ABJN52_17075 [Litorimonas sp.]